MDLYTGLLLILFVAAILDLIVGVSNDAVNFLNSAIGSKVASLRTILIIASLGVLVGSTFSSGMMEVARNGLFNPGFFTFEQVTFLFLAVMLTDVILLDFFNNLGLPTSTTVSLVFELLGAAFSIGVLHSFSQGLSWETIDIKNIINYSSAITIVSGIFLSIFLAFIVGSIVQRISRVLFTFSLKKSIKKYGAIFCGLATTTIIYFLLIKGAKGSSLITDDQVQWVMANTVFILLGSLVFFSFVIQLVMWYSNINPLRVVVLLGTFALAMAFAGNDLVNFIGVAMGGLISFQHWSASGVAADQYYMSALAEKIATPAWMLLLAGVIMVITLWTNAKSRKVTETTILLSRQDEGDERFKPTMVSRVLVGFALFIGRFFELIMPQSWLKALDKRLKKEKKIEENILEKDKPSFDLVRASVNLLVASILIAYGTSQKLPLSTTFVTFMVAMGTSFADQAWGRESAVYRVAGVMNVIAGWISTALIAFTFSAFIAFILYKTEITGVLIITAAAAFLLIRSHLIFGRKQKEESAENKIFTNNLKSIRQAIDESKEVTTKNLKIIGKMYSTSVESLAKEKKNPIEKSITKIKQIRLQNEKVQHKIIKYVKKMPKQNLAASRLYILMFDHMQDLYQSTQLISENCTSHLKNFHSSPSKDYIKTLSEIDKGLQNSLNEICESVGSGKYTNHESIIGRHEKWMTVINQTIDNQIVLIQKDNIGNRLGMLQMRLLIETRDIFTTLHSIYNLYYNYHQQEKP